MQVMIRKQRCAMQDHMLHCPHSYHLWGLVWLCGWPLQCDVHIVALSVVCYQAQAAC